MPDKTILYSRGKSPSFLLEAGTHKVIQYPTGHVEMDHRPGRVFQFYALRVPVPFSKIPCQKVRDPRDPDMMVRGAQGYTYLEDEAERLGFAVETLKDIIMRHPQRGVEFDFAGEPEVHAVDATAVTGDPITNNGDGTYFCQPCGKMLATRQGMLVHCARSNKHLEYLASLESPPAPTDTTEQPEEVAASA